MDYKIRRIKENEYPLLNDFLYEAIFVPEGIQAPPADIIYKPELQVYTKDFGKETDICFVSETNGKVIGAVWTRIMNDYGHIDDETPSLAISLYNEYRNMGIGTALMKKILIELKSKGYKQVSLSVQKDNYAFRMYQKLGFRIYSENSGEYIMLCALNGNNSQ